MLVIKRVWVNDDGDVIDSILMNNGMYLAYSGPGSERAGGSRKNARWLGRKYENVRTACLDP